MLRIPDETYGIIENLLAAMIFFCPNFFIIVIPKDYVFILLLYNYVIIFLVVTALSHVKYTEHATRETEKLK